MRFQDELVTSFRSLAQIEPRRYLIRQLADLAVTFDFFEVTDALRNEGRRFDTPLWAQAASALSTLQPRALPARYGFDPRRDLFAGVVDAGAPGGAKAAPAASWISIMPGAVPGRGPTNEVWIGAGCHLLEECLEPLLAAARSAVATRRGPALRALARFLHHRARNELKDLARTDRMAAMALALTGDPDAEPVLLEVLAKSPEPRPELVALLGRYPSRETARELKRLIADRDVGMRIAAALALEGFADFDPVGLAQPLMRAGESRWPLVHLADSLGRAGGADAVPQLIELYDLTADPLAQVAIVRSVANLGGQRAAPFLWSLLDGALNPVKAVAVEGLVQVRVPKEELRPRLMPLLDSTYPRLAANALVALAEIDAGEAAKRLVNWVRAGDEALRLEGAFILGYMKSPSALRVSAKMAQGDPSPVVRMEHLRALSKYPPAEAAPLLEACLSQADPRVRSRAIRLWIRAFPLPPAELSHRLMEMLKQETESSVRATLVESLGLVGQPGAHAGLIAELGGADETVSAAALGALAAAGASGSESAIARHVADAEPVVKARGAVALWALGDLGARKLLVELLSGDDAALAAGAEALEEICLMLPSLPASPRHTALNTLLTNHVRTPAYEAFSRERLGIKPAVRPAARAFKDAEQADAAAPERADTAATTEALTELDRSGAMASLATQGTAILQQLVRLPLDLPEVRGIALWSPARKVAAGAVLMAVALGFVAMRSGSSAAARLAPLDIATIAPGKLMVLRVSGGVKGGGAGAPAAPIKLGELLAAPATLSTDATGRLGVAAQLGANRVELGHNSALTVRAIVPGKTPAAYRMQLAEVSGALTVNFSTGEPSIEIDLPGTKLSAEALVGQLSVHGKRVELVVQFGQARLARPDGEVVLAAPGRLAWDGGSPPPQVSK